MSITRLNNCQSVTDQIVRAAITAKRYGFSYIMCSREQGQLPSAWIIDSVLPSASGGVLFYSSRVTEIMSELS